MNSFRFTPMARSGSSAVRSAIWPSALIASRASRIAVFGRLVGDQDHRLRRTGRGAPARSAAARAGAGRSIPARSACPPCAWRSRRRRPAGRRPTGGYSSRPHAPASPAWRYGSRLDAGRPKVPTAVAARDVGDVAHHRGGGGVAAGARAGQDELADEIRLDRDGVGDAVDAGDGRGFRHHRRVDPLLDAGLGAARDAEQLDAVAELVRRLDVGGRDRRDALDIDRRRRRSRCRRRWRSAAPACGRCRGPPMSKVGSASA